MSDGNIVNVIQTTTSYVSLSPDRPLNIPHLLSLAKHPSAGAVVLFAGTTRSFSRPEPCCSSHEDQHAPPGVTKGTRGAKRALGSEDIGDGKRRRLSGVSEVEIEEKEERENEQSEGRGEVPRGYENITRLTYHSYAPLALRSMRDIAGKALQRWGTTASPHPLKGHGKDSGNAQKGDTVSVPSEFLRDRKETSEIETRQDQTGLMKVVIAHRLGEVPVGEESVVVCVSAMHRGTAWRAGEWCLEEVKKRVEIWKWEEFIGDEYGKESETAMWRSNAIDGGGRKIE